MTRRQFAFLAAVALWAVLLGVLLEMPPFDNIGESILWIVALMLWLCGAVATLLFPIVGWLLKRHDARP